MAEPKAALEEIKTDIESLLAKFESEVSNTGVVTVVKTHLQAAAMRIEQEIAKYKTPTEPITPHPATQNPATNGQLGVPDNPGKTP